MRDLTHLDLEQHLVRLEAKIDVLAERLYALDKALAVHKAKTSWMAAVMGGFASLLVAVSGALWKLF